MSGHKAKTHEDVVKCIEKSIGKDPEKACKAMFYFLYKEILVNRAIINEGINAANRGAFEYDENLINDLNAKLMEQLK